jgi:hypothetical protein
MTYTSLYLILAPSQTTSKERDHAGHIREVPQEGASPSTYSAQVMCKFNEKLLLKPSLLSCINQIDA